ncbi:hypothetical protein [Nonomuraea sp. NPDC049709]
MWAYNHLRRGPVRLAAKPHCVQWGGNYGKLQYTSKFEHCG